MSRPDLTSLAASFAPPFVVRALVRGTAPDRPWVKPMPAAVWFADIAGFSRLARRAEEVGPEGAEQVAQAVRSTLGPITEAVALYGGQVVQFAGDGLLAWWRITSRGPTPALNQAAACALEVQGRLASAAAEPVAIGLGVGQAFGARLGGVGGRWLAAVGGPAVQQAHRAAGLATAGKILASPEAWPGLAARGRAGPDGHWWLHGAPPTAPSPARPLDVPDHLVPALVSHVPVPLLPWLEAGQARWIAELRTVSIAFCELPGLASLDPGRVQHLQRLQDLVVSMQLAAQEQGAVVDNLVQDDKGGALMAVLGVPGASHGDDAARAASLALSLQALARRAGGQGRVGLATGRVFCGVVGTEHRRAYTVFGVPVNRAARLMQAASSSVLADRATQRAAPRLVARPHPPLQLKGWDEPVAAWHLDSLRPRGLASTDRPLLGRGPELAMLRAAVEALVGTGTGGLVLLEGPAGIGKSRLVAEVAPAAGRCLVATGEADRGGQPYSAWRGLLAELLGVSPGQAGAAATLREQVRGAVQSRALPPLADDLLPLLDDALPLGLGDTAATRALRAEARADRTRELLLMLLAAIGRLDREPTLLVLEDLHWWDSASLSLARAVRDRAWPVLLLATTRPRTLPQGSALLGDGDSAHLRLGPLCDDDVDRLAASLLGVRRLDRHLARLVRERSEGVPFWVEELALSLLEAGPEGALPALPARLDSLVAARLGTLDPTSALALKVASILGRTFTTEQLAAAWPDAPPEDLGGILHGLVQAEVLVADGEEQWAFPHAITRDVAYDSLLFSQRRDLHARVAHFLADRDDRGEAAVLAEHWHRAGEDEQALTCLERAGQEALRLGSYREAEGLLARAIELASPVRRDDQARARLHRWLGEARLGLGDLVGGRAALGSAAHVLDRALPPPRRLMSRAAIEGLGLLLRRARVEPAPDPAALETAVEAASSYQRLVEVGYLGNSLGLYIYAAMRGLRVALRAGPSPELAKAWAFVVPIVALTRVQAWLETARWRAAQVAEKVGDPATRARVWHILSIQRIGDGDLDRAREGLERAVALTDESFDRRQRAESITGLAMVAAFRGEHETTRALAAEVEDLGLACGSELLRLWGVDHGARALLGLDQPHRALALLQRGDGLAPAEREINHQALWALAALQAGQRRVARDCAERASTLTAQVRSVRISNLHGLDALAEVWLGLAASGEAEALPQARAAIRELARYARLFPVGRSRWLQHRAILAGLQGRLGQARRLLDRADEQARALGSAHDQARVAAARALLEAGRPLAGHQG